MLAYKSCGDGTPIVFIHGWGMSSSVWEGQMEELSASFRVITVDLPGHGEAPGEEEPLTISGSAELVAGLIEGLDLIHANLVGWSLGAQVACLAALILGRERISSVTIVGGTPCYVAPSRKDGWGMPEGKAKWFRRELKKDFRAALERFILTFFEGVRELPPNAGSPIKERLFPETFPPSEKQAMELLDDLYASDIRNKLGGMDMPCLICHGTNDKIVPIGIVEIWKSLLPASRAVLFDGGGHAPFLTEPAFFNSTLSGFIHSIK